MEQDKKNKIINDIAKTALVVGGAFLIFKTVQHGSKYLKQIDSPLVGVQKASLVEFNRLDSHSQGIDKLKTIDRFIQKNDSVSKEIALLLISSTFERFLFDLHRCSCNTKLVKDRGILYIAKDLRSNDIIDRDLYEKIKHFTDEIRNPAVHGHSNRVKIEDARKHFSWIKKFMLKSTEQYKKRLSIS